MKYLVRPDTNTAFANDCSARCGENCLGKCNQLGHCFCALKGVGV